MFRHCATGNGKHIDGASSAFLCAIFSGVKRVCYPGRAGTPPSDQRKRCPSGQVAPVEVAEAVVGVADEELVRDGVDVEVVSLVTVLLEWIEDFSLDGLIEPVVVGAGFAPGHVFADCPCNGYCGHRPIGRSGSEESGTGVVLATGGLVPAAGGCSVAASS